MATFYGQVFGKASTGASRTGSRNSGIRTSAQSYDGSVIVELRQPRDGEGDGGPIVTVEVSDGTSSYGVELFRGSLDGLCQKLGGKTLAELSEEGW